MGFPTVRSIYFFFLSFVMAFVSHPHRKLYFLFFINIVRSLNIGNNIRHSNSNTKIKLKIITSERKNLSWSYDARNFHVFVLVGFKLSFVANVRKGTIVPCVRTPFHAIRFYAWTKYTADHENWRSNEEGKRILNLAMLIRNHAFVVFGLLPLM